jgi:hypothetical protein
MYPTIAHQSAHCHESTLGGSRRHEPSQAQRGIRVMIHCQEAETPRMWFIRLCVRPPEKPTVSSWKHIVVYVVYVVDKRIGAASRSVTWAKVLTSSHLSRLSEP